MADFRHRTIAPMRETNSIMRRTIEQSLQTIATTRAAIERADELMRAADDALVTRRRQVDIT